MELFKNGVGRPSNETLKKRRNIKLVIAVFVIALVCVGAYYINGSASFKEISSKNKNTQTATAVAEINLSGTGVFKRSDGSNQDIGLYDIYGKGTFTATVNFMKPAKQNMYYKIFSYQTTDYNTNPKVYKTCSVLSGVGSNLASQSIKLNLFTDRRINALKVRIYSTSKECSADTTSTKTATYGQTIALFRVASSGDIASAPKYNIGDGKITQEDVDTLKKYLSGLIDLSDVQKFAADLNSDGRIDQTDLNLLQEKVYTENAKKMIDILSAYESSTIASLGKLSNLEKLDIAKRIYNSYYDETADYTKITGKMLRNALKDTLGTDLGMTLTSIKCPRENKTLYSYDSKTDKFIRTTASCASVGVISESRVVSTTKKGNIMNVVVERLYMSNLGGQINPTKYYLNFNDAYKQKNGISKNTDVNLTDLLDINKDKLNKYTFTFELRNNKYVFKDFRLTQKNTVNQTSNLKKMIDILDMAESGSIDSLKRLTNLQKLDIALKTYKAYYDESADYTTVTVKQLKEALIDSFGTDLGIVPSSIKCPRESKILYSYNSKTDKFTRTTVSCASAGVISESRIVNDTSSGNTRKTVVERYYLSNLGGEVNQNVFYLTYSDAYDGKNGIYANLGTTSVFEKYKNQLKQYTYTFELKNNDYIFKSYTVTKSSTIKPLNSINKKENIYGNLSTSQGDYGLSVGINPDGRSATLRIDWTKFAKIAETKSSVSTKQYKITGFTKKIRSTFIGDIGQSPKGITLFYLMEDGTVEYTPMFNLKYDQKQNSYYEINYTYDKTSTGNVTGEHFETKGKIIGVSRVTKLYNADYTTNNHFGGRTTVGMLSNGTFYDLGAIINAK